MLGQSDLTDQSADKKIIETLEREITVIKAEIKQKQSEITQIEKECGIKHQSDLAKKFEPVTVAFENFAAKAKPVMLAGAEKVRITAHQIINRPTADDNSKSLKTSPDPSENESNAPSTLTTEAKKNTTDEDDIERQKKLDHLEELKESLADQKTILSSKESEVVWLYQKNKMTRPNALTRFSSNIRNSASYQRMGTSLDQAKVTAKANMKSAGIKTRELWFTAGVKAKSLSISFKERWNKPSTETKT